MLESRPSYIIWVYHVHFVFVWEREFLIDLNFGEGVHQCRVISVNRIRVIDVIADSQFMGDKWGMDNFNSEIKIKVHQLDYYTLTRYCYCIN